jgi:DeoR/GlpR family transcriptional regulator of sugar metabolism
VRSDAKAAIARQAAQQVHDGDTVILDSGSTTYEVAVALRKHRELSVITNDLRISTYIASLRGFRLLVTGGELLGSVYTLVGDHAVEFLGSYAADWAFLGADAIDTHSGVTNTNTLEVPVKRAMIKAARTAVVVADSSKFGRRALAKVAGLDEIDFVVTDPDLPGETAEHWGIRLIQAVRA